MEFCNLGSLTDLMEVCGSNCFNEKQIAFISRECLKGLEYLHIEQKIVHM